MSIDHALPCDFHLVSVTELVLWCSLNMTDEVLTESSRTDTQFVTIGIVTFIPYARESVNFYRNSHILPEIGEILCRKSPYYFELRGNWFII